jgi:hypothetical protein
MGGLSDSDQGYLDRLQFTQRLATWLGIVLTVLGVAYVVWALHLFDWRVDPRTQSSFDGPVAQLAFLYDSYQGILDRIQPETPVEEMLLAGIERGMFFSAGTMVMMMRIYLGTLVALMGLIALTVVVERRRLLRLIDKLQAPEGSR